MGRLFIASKLNTQKLRMIFAALLLLAPSVFAQCGVGSQCKTKVGVETCTPCPAGTSCSQWTTSSGSLGHFTVSTPCAWLRGLFVTIELAHAVLAWSAVRQVRQQWHRPAITLQQQQQQPRRRRQQQQLLPALLQQPLQQQF